MPNDRYVAVAERFENGNYYEAPAVGNFNPSTSAFGAFCLFYFLGEYQDTGLADTPPDPMFLWGNYDSVAENGWSLEVGVNPTVGSVGPALLANVGTGGATQQLVYALTGGSVISATGFIEKLILFELWQDDNFCCAAINGSIITANAAGDTHFSPPFVITPSALKARIGLSPNGANPANFAGIVSCGYFNGLTGANTMGGQIGQHWRNARAALQGAPILENGPTIIDWAHRYEAATLFAQYYTLQQNAGGYAITNQNPTAPAAWPDSSIGTKIFNSAPVAPVHVALARQGTGAEPLLSSIKNPDWFVPTGPTVWLANAPA